MSEQETLRLIAEVVDKYSGPLKQMQNSLDNLASKTKGVHADGVSQTSKHSKAYADLGEQMRSVKTTGLDVLRPALSSVGIEALTVAGAIATIGRAVKNYGEAGQALEFTRRNSGLAAGTIRSLAEAGERLGISTSETNASLATFGARMDALQRRAPAALQAYNELPGLWQKIGRSLQGLNREQQLEKIFKFVPTVKYADQRRRVLSFYGLPEDWASLTEEEIVKLRAKGDDFNKAHPMALQNAAASKAAWDDIGSAVRGIRDDMGAAFGPSVVAGIRQLQTFLENKKNLDAFAERMGNAATSVGDIVRGYQNLEIILNHDVFGKKSLKDEIDDNPNAKARTFKQRFAPFDGQDTPDTRSLGDALKSSTESGVFDGLTRWYNGLSGSPEAKAFAGGYTPMAYHPSGGGGGKGAAFGSKDYPALDPSNPMGSGGSRGDRNNNPGNLKFGALARQFGATHADDKGFAVFPDAQSGSAAHDALIKSSRYSGLTLNQFGNKYSEGNADWKKTVGKELGIGPNDKVDNQDPRLSAAIRKAEGTGGGIRMSGPVSGIDAHHMDPMAPAGTGIQRGGMATITSPSGKRFQVAAWAAPNFQRFVDNYEKAGGSLGSATGTLGMRGHNASYHPLGRAIDVNQTGYGVRGGNGKVLPRAVEDKLAEEAGLWPGSRFGDAGHFEARNRDLVMAKQKQWQDESRSRGADMRDHIRGRASHDLLTNGKRSEADSLRDSLSNSLVVDINHNNAPRGTTAKFRSDGEMFKAVKLNRGSPQSQASQDS